jgi:hypothetical protein
VVEAKMQLLQSHPQKPL